MAVLLYSATASLDGYIAGPGGDMSWLTEHIGTPNPTADRVLRETGALLVGHRTFIGDDPNRGTEREGAFGGQYRGPVVVLAHHPPAQSPPAVTFADNLPDACRIAKEAAGDHYVNVLGADVARQCLDAQLLDEILILFAPVLLGDGTRILWRPDQPPPTLTRRNGEPEHWYRIAY